MSGVIEEMSLANKYKFFSVKKSGYHAMSWSLFKTTFASKVNAFKNSKKVECSINLDKKFAFQNNQASLIGKSSCEASKSIRLNLQMIINISKNEIV